MDTINFRMNFMNTPERLDRIADFKVRVRLGIHENRPWPFLEFSDKIIMDEQMMEHVLDHLAHAIDATKGVAEPDILGLKVTQFLQDMLVQFKVMFEGESEIDQEVEYFDIDTGEDVDLRMD